MMSWRKPQRDKGDGNKAKEVKRVNTRRGKKERNMTKIIWVWASLALVIQSAQSRSAWCAVRS